MAKLDKRDDEDRCPEEYSISVGLLSISPSFFLSLIYSPSFSFKHISTRLCGVCVTITLANL